MTALRAQCFLKPMTVLAAALALTACSPKQATTNEEKSQTAAAPETVQASPTINFERPSEVFAALQIPEQCPQSESLCTTQLPSTPEAIAKALGLPLNAWEKGRATTDTDPPVSYDTYSHHFTPELSVSISYFDFGVVVNAFHIP